MKRRKFIKTSAIAASAGIGMPYFMSSKTAFARSAAPMVDHVVLVLFAGGVRQQESVLQRYLADSQGETNIDGNILYNLFSGGAPSQKIVYGTDINGGVQGGQPIPKILSQSLESQGTTFAEVAYSQGGTGHFSGLNTLLTGNYNFVQGLKERPVNPTIFEYLRKYRSIPASKVWFVGNGIGNSVPLLNYSTHELFGADFGGNFLAPNITFGNPGENNIKNAKAYHPEEELGPIYEMQFFLDNVFQFNAGTLNGVSNTDDEKHDIKEFIKTTFIKKDSGTIAFPPVNDNGDLSTMGYACEVMKWFEPTLTVINMNSIDSCHSSFTSYLRNLHRCDHGVGHIWNYIQTQIPAMSGNTMVLIIPEHGRNLDPNPIIDGNNFKAFDHDSDPNSRRIFSMMAGPGIDANLVKGSESNPIGDASDALLTVADALGIKNEVISEGLIDGAAQSFFDQI
ncbi:MAG: hypothetical protein HKN92_10845 [Chitinophagales bacterium]|nr:hypothetical protein [Chitinophagales bacterium]